jgi:release factor glutamine methyltransferase
MTVREALREGYVALAGVDSPVLDATLLLAEAAGVSKERLLADLPETLEASSIEAYRVFLDLRLHGQPVSYIRRRKEFYGLEMYVDERVLVPRPETETLVACALELAREHGGRVRLHDACTGSGCVAIACAYNYSLDASVSDISPLALEVCACNSRRHLGRELTASVSDLLEAVTGPYDIITANPPYLADVEARRMREGGWPEPTLALVGGEQGVELALRLVAQAVERLAPGGTLLVEIAPDQAAALVSALAAHGYGSVRTVCDLAGRARVVAGRRP